MANKFGTETLKALGLRMLPILKNELRLPAIVANRWDATRVEAVEGETISVKRPVVFVAKDFVSTIDIQEISRRLVDIKLNTFKDISFELTTKEMTFIMNNDKKKTEELLTPAFAELADQADREIIKLFDGVPYHTGNPAVAFDDVSSILEPRRIMNERKVSSKDRNIVMSSEMAAQLLALDAFRDLDKTGSTTALTEASLGRKFGFNMYETNESVKHNVGDAITLAPAGDITLSADSGSIVAQDNQDIVNVERTIFAITGLNPSTSQLNDGELMKVVKDGITYDFVQRGAYLDAGGTAQIQVYPVYRDTAGVPIVFNSGSVVEFAGRDTGEYNKNIAFKKEAFAFAPVALAQVPDGTGVAMKTINADGIAFRLTMGYDQVSKKMVFSVDMLTGYAVLYDVLAQVVIGGQ